MSILQYLKQSLRNGVRTMTSRRIYMVSMIVLPLFMCVFLVTLLQSGLPVQVPTAVVDLDRSQLSREVTRSLKAQQLAHVTAEYDSYEDALDAVRGGKAYGFFVIPRNFQRDAVAGNMPTIEYYSNMVYFVAGTFSFKGYKSVAVSSAAGMLGSEAESAGLTPAQVRALIQPVNINVNAIHNPWPSYSVYLTPSFMAAALALMIMVVTVFSITSEIKNGTSRRWLSDAGNSIVLAVTGKLLPQTVVFSIVALCIQGVIYGFCHFPMYGSVTALIFVTILFVVANQSMGLFLASAIPNMRMALSAAALLSILAFSFCGFSFPVEHMYGALGVFSYIMPVRYYFLYYISNILNGFPIYYCRWDIAALILFVIGGGALLWRLKRVMLRPVYIP